MQIIVTPRAQKQYLRLPAPEVAKIKKKLLLVEQNPLVGKKLSGEFSELRCVRAWPYRIFCFVNEKQKKIFIVTIAHRQGHTTV